jgi:hypothetical protein
LNLEVAEIAHSDSQPAHPPPTVAASTQIARDLTKFLRKWLEINNKSQIIYIGI